MSNVIPRVLLPDTTGPTSGLSAVLSRPELTHDRNTVIARRGAIKIHQQPRPCSTQSLGPLDEAWARLPAWRTIWPSAHPWRAVVPDGGDLYEDDRKNIASGSRRGALRR
jgi:hypothetical protein